MRDSTDIVNRLNIIAGFVAIVDFERRRFEEAFELGQSLLEVKR